MRRSLFPSLAAPPQPSSFLSLAPGGSPSSLCFRTEPPTIPDRAFASPFPLPLPPRMPLLPDGVGSYALSSARTTFTEIVKVDRSSDERWDPVSHAPPPVGPAFARVETWPRSQRPPRSPRRGSSTTSAPRARTLRTSLRPH